MRFRFGPLLEGRGRRDDVHGTFRISFLKDGVDLGARLWGDPALERPHGVFLHLDEVERPRLLSRGPPEVNAAVVPQQRMTLDALHIEEVFPQSGAVFARGERLESIE